MIQINVRNLFNFFAFIIRRMGNSTSVSSSRVVTLTKTPICANGDCKNRVAFDKIYCTLHDMNPMRTEKVKKEVKKVESQPCYCCSWMFALS